MIDFLYTFTARLTIQLTLLVIMLVVAWYVLRKLRGHNKDDETTSNYLTNFHEMRQRGVLSDKEFRTIKTSLTPSLRNEINDDGEPH